MPRLRTLEQLWEALRADRAVIAAQPAGLGAARRRLDLEEIHASTALAGSALGVDEVSALVEHGLTGAGRRLSECILVADYADAARYVRAAPAAGRRQPFVRTDEIVALHLHALRRAPEARPGVWRGTTIPAFPSGMVATPAWLIARDIAAFVDRFAAGPPPDANPLPWLADAHVRFTRIQPFTAGNGRVARLLTNLLLRRLGFPPLIVPARQRERYAAERVPAASRRLETLAGLFARWLLSGTSALVASSHAGDGLRPLAAYAGGAERAALYKAAQRDRLRTVRRGSAVLTTAAWIADYRASHHRRERT